jgi:hypothetical protein
MTSLQTPQAASPPDRSLLENGSPIKNVVAQSQSSLGEYLAAQVDDSTNGGPSQRRDATGATASSKDKQSQKRLSQVVPQRPKGKELVNEEEPWDAKNVLSLGMMAYGNLTLNH